MSDFYLDKLNGRLHERLLTETGNYALFRERTDELPQCRKGSRGHKKAKPAKVTGKSLRSDQGSFLSHLGNPDGCLKVMDLLLSPVSTVQLAPQFQGMSLETPFSSRRVSNSLLGFF